MNRPGVTAENDSEPAFADLPAAVRLRRRVLGAVALPFLIVAGMVSTALSGHPDDPDNWLARSMAWALEPFRKWKARRSPR